MYNNFTVLGGEPAVPYTCNPLQQGWMPSEALSWRVWNR